MVTEQQFWIMLKIKCINFFFSTRFTSGRKKLHIQQSNPTFSGSAMHCRIWWWIATGIRFGTYFNTYWQSQVNKWKIQFFWKIKLKFILCNEKVSVYAFYFKFNSNLTYSFTTCKKPMNNCYNCVDSRTLVWIIWLTFEVIWTQFIWLDCMSVSSISLQNF